MRFELGSTALKKLFHFLFVLLGCLHLAGGPFSLIQGYAWVSMLVTYSQDGGFVQAAKDTFSGEKPCELCTRIASAREAAPAQQEPLAPAPVSSSKLLQEIIASEPLALKLPRATDVILPAFPSACGFPGHDRDAPPVPPPCRAA